MMTKFLAGILLCSLVGCAGGPRPSTKAVPGPEMGEGEYVFTGHVASLGPIAGRLHVDSVGAVVLSEVSLVCPVPLIAAESVVLATSCTPTLTALRESGSGAGTATVVVAVTTVTERTPRYPRCVNQVYMASDHCIVRPETPVTRTRIHRGRAAIQIPR